MGNEGCCGNRKSPPYWLVGQQGGTIPRDNTQPRSIAPGQIQPGNYRNGQPKVGLTAGYQAGRLTPPLTALPARVQNLIPSY